MSKRSDRIKKPGKGNGGRRRATTGQISDVTVHFAQCCSNIQPVIDKSGRPMPMDRLDLKPVGSMDQEGRELYDAAAGGNGSEGYLCILREGRPVGAIDPVARKFKLYVDGDESNVLGQLQRGLRSRGYGNL